MSGIWTPTVAGKYLITAGIVLSTPQNDGTQLLLTIVATGGGVGRDFSYFPSGAAAALFVSGSDLFSVAVGQTYSVQINNQLNNSVVAVVIERLQEASGISACGNQSSYFGLYS